MFKCFRILALRSVCVLGVLAILSAAMAKAQSSLSPDESSSNSTQLVSADGAGGMPEGGAGGGAGGKIHRGFGMHNLTNQLAFEAGAGFNGPIGNDQPYVTWGGNFTVGAGLLVSFAKRCRICSSVRFSQPRI